MKRSKILTILQKKRRITGTSFDPDAAAYFAAVPMTDLVQKDAINTFIVSAKAHGYWTKLDRIWVFPPDHGPDAGDLTCMKSLSVMTNHGLDLAEGRVFFDGASTYIDTGFIPATHSTGGANNFSLGFHTANADGFGQDPGPAAYPMGAIQLNKSVNFQVDYNPDIYGQIGLGSPIIDYVFDNPGWFGVTRNSTTSCSSYSNGVFYSIDGSTNTYLLPTISAFLGMANLNGSPANGWGGDMDLAWFGTALTAQNFLDFYNDWATMELGFSRP